MRIQFQCDDGRLFVARPEHAAALFEVRSRVGVLTVARAQDLIERYQREELVSVPARTP